MADTFRRDNTEGYSVEDLAELNKRFDREWQAEELDGDDVADFDRYIMAKHIAERVQYAFDKENPGSGRRLRTGYYDVED